MYELSDESHDPSECCLDNKPSKRSSVYPCDCALIALYEKHRRPVLVARELGVTHITLKDYVSRRPLLAASCFALVGLPEDVKRQRELDAQRRWRHSPEGREKKRAANRRWAARRSSKDVQKWNKYNAERRAQQRGPRLSVEEAQDAAYWEALIRADICSYCGGSGGTSDHIEAVDAGGSDRWDNLAGACQSCNSSKKAKGLLQFMMWRLDNVAA